MPRQQRNKENFSMYKGKGSTDSDSDDSDRPSGKNNNRDNTFDLINMVSDLFSLLLSKDEQPKTRPDGPGNRSMVAYGGNGALQNAQNRALSEFPENGYRDCNLIANRLKESGENIRIQLTKMYCTFFESQSKTSRMTIDRLQSLRNKFNYNFKNELKDLEKVLSDDSTTGSSSNNNNK